MARGTVGTHRLLATVSSAMRADDGPTGGVAGGEGLVREPFSESQGMSMLLKGGDDGGETGVGERLLRRRTTVSRTKGTSKTFERGASAGGTGSPWPSTVTLAAMLAIACEPRERIAETKRGIHTDRGRSAFVLHMGATPDRVLLTRR